MLPVHQAGQCSVAATGEIIGSKWTVLIVHDLSEGPRRFTELERSCAGISPRTLAERLRWLESAEIVARHGLPAAGRHSLQIEINRGLYMDEERIEKAAGFDRLKTDIERLIAAEPGEATHPTRAPASRAARAPSPGAPAS